MNRRLMLIIIFSFNNFCAIAQNHEIDSLRKILKTDNEDTSKINHLNNLAYAYNSIKLDSTILLAQQAASLAIKTGWKKGEANSYRNEGTGYNSNGNYSKALAFYQKALAINQKIENKSGIAACFSNIGKVYYEQGDYSNAMNYCMQALKLAGEIGSKRDEASVFQTMGNISVQQSDFAKALDCYTKSMKISEQTGNKLSQGATLGNIGSIYIYLGDYSKALNYYLESLKLLNTIGNKPFQANTLCNIGSVYERLKDYSKALTYYNDALKWTPEQLHGTILHNIGNVYSDQGNYSKALDYFLNALKLEEENGDKNKIEHFLISIGNVYFYQHDYPRGLESYYKALNLSREAGDKGNIALNLSNIGSIYLKEKKYMQARAYLDSALTLSKITGEKNTIKDIYGNLTQLDSLQENFRTAWADYKNHIIYRDSLVNEDNTKKTVQAEMNYTFERKTDSTKAEQDKLNIITASTLKKNKILNWVAGFIVILLLIIGFLTYNRINIKSKFEQELAVAKERKRISNEMHDDLGSGLSKISLLSDMLNQGKKSKYDEIYLKNISDSSKEMIDKMGNIVWALNTNFDKAENLVSYTSRYTKEFFESTNIQCIVNQPETLPDISIDGETRQNVFLTVKEALHNVLKHSQATTATITISTNKNLLKINIHDNGRGLDLTQKSLSGNGLNNMRKRMEDVAGSFEMLNHNGTTIQLSLPLKA